MNSIPFLSLLGELFAKSIVILAVALLVDRARSNASAAQRNLVLYVAFGALLLLPATRLFEPRWAVPVVSVMPPAPVVTLVSAATQTPPEAILPESTSAPREGRWRWPDWRVSLLAIWMVGTALVLSQRAIASVRLRFLRKSSEALKNELVRQLADKAFSEAGLERPVDLRVAAGVAVPLTWGTWRPVLVLPVASLEWTDVRVLAALRHEAAHIARADHLVRFFAHLACAFYWLNPLVWLAARQLRIAQEQAADDRVLRAGTAPADYAAQLFDVARALAAPSRVVTGAVAMACPSTLERRMLAIVDGERDRRPLSVRTIVAGAWALFLTLGLATATQMQAQNPSPATSGASVGSISDEPARPAVGSSEGSGRLVEVAVKFIEISSSGERPALPDFMKASAADAKPDVRVVLMDPEMQAAIRALNQMKGVDLLSSPRVTTHSGQKAMIEVVREFKYPTAFEKDAKTNEWAPSNFENKNVGVSFEVVPELNSEGKIALHMVPEVTEFEGYLDLDAGANDRSKLSPDRIPAGPDANTFPSGYRKQPIFSTRTLTADATINAGETVVLGALIREDVQKVEDSVPVLGDIPVVGRFFRSTTERHFQRRLFVFVTATVVPEQSAAAASKPGSLEIQAESITRDSKSGVVTAAGSVEIKTPDATIHTGKAEIRPKTK